MKLTQKEQELLNIVKTHRFYPMSLLTMNFSGRVVSSLQQKKLIKQYNSNNGVVGVVLVDENNPCV